MLPAKRRQTSTFRDRDEADHSTEANAHPLSRLVLMRIIIEDTYSLFRRARARRKNALTLELLTLSDLSLKKSKCLYLKKIMYN